MKFLFDKKSHEINKILLETWKMDELRFVGKYVLKNLENNIGYFTDIRSTDYVSLSYPNNVDEIANEKLEIFTFHDSFLEPDVYYEFSAVLQGRERREKRNNPFLLRADFSSTPPIKFIPDPKKFIERRYEIVRLTPLLTEDQLSKSIETISSEINKKPETFIFELLQNSDDYPDSTKKVNVSFEITSKYLKFTHTGNPFKVNNVHAICGVNEKDKGDDVEKIGFKGIGFKSVFKDSNFVYVNSGGYQFRFDEKYHSNRTFWQTIPIWTENLELDREIRNHDFLNSPVSVALRPKNSKILNDNFDDKGNDISYANTLKSIFSDDRILLFLRHVQVVSISIPNINTIFCRKESYNWWLKKFRIEIPEIQKIELNKRISYGKNKDPRVPEKYYNLEQTFISFAASRQGNEIIKTKQGGVFIYLPTQIDLKFPFLINGDFIPDGSREQLHSDIDWNSFLMKEAGKLFVNWLAEIGNNRWKDKYDKEYEFKRDYVNLIPDFKQCKNSIDTKHHVFVDDFEEGFTESLEEIAFIPDYQNKLRKLNEILVDETGIVELLGFEQFKEITDCERILIHGDLLENEVIWRLVGDEQIFRKKDLQKLLDADFFVEWFKTPANCISLIELLADKGKNWIKIIEDKAIFIDQNNELKCANELYFDLSEELHFIDWCEPNYLLSEIREVLKENEKFCDWAEDNFKTFEITPFLEDKLDELGEFLLEQNKNILFYQFLYRHKEHIEESIISRLQTLPILTIENEYISTTDTTFYFSNEELSYIIKNNIIPSDFFKILYENIYYQNEIDKEEWRNFWIEFFEISEFQPTEFLENVVFDDNNYVSLVEHIDKKNNNILFFRLLYRFRVNLNDKLRKDIKDLIVFDINNQSILISNNIIFLNSEEIEDVKKDDFLPEGLFNIISEEYMEGLSEAEDWKQFWEETCGILPFNLSFFLENVVFLSQNQDVIFKHISEQKCNISFYRFLFKNIRDLLNKNLKNKIKNFPIFSSQNQLLSFSDNLFLPNSELQDIQNGNMLPNETFEVISLAYCSNLKDNMEWEIFWKEFDILEYEPGTFINDFILANKVEVNNYQDEENSIILWRFLFSNRKSEFDKKQLKELYILSKHDETIEFKYLKDCYLSNSYLPFNPIEEIVKQFNQQSAFFICDDYLGSNEGSDEWSKFFKSCGVKHDENNVVINDLIPDLANRSVKSSIDDIRLIYRFRTEIEKKDKIEDLKSNLKVKTIDGSFISISDCFIGDYYTGKSLVKECLASIELPNQISDEYLLNLDDRPNWLEFWLKLVDSDNCLDSIEKILTCKINFLVEGQEEIEENHINHFQELLPYYLTKDVNGKCLYEDILSHLKVNWQLKGQDSNFYNANQLYLPSCYAPKFDLDDLGVVEEKYLSDEYNNLPEAKSFLVFLAVNENFTQVHLKYLNQPKVSKAFWTWIIKIWSPSYTDNWLKKHFKSLTPSEVIPTIEGLKESSVLYSLDLKELVVDKSKLPSIDLRTLKIDDTSLENWLGIQQKLSYQDCLEYIKTEPSNKENLLKVLKMYLTYSPTIEANISYTNEFKINGKWLNSQNEWLPLTKLIYFDSKDYQRIFGQIENRIKFHHSLTADECKKICNRIGIPIIEDNSLKVTIKDQTIDNNFRNTLIKCLELISFDAFHEDDWKVKYENYLAILGEWQFLKCSKIVIDYQGNGFSLEASANKIYEDKTKTPKELCYVESWDNKKVYADLVSKIKSIFNLEQKKDDLMDFFDDRNDALRRLKNKGLNLPSDWLREIEPPIETNNFHKTKSTFNSKKFEIRYIESYEYDDNFNISSDVEIDTLATSSGLSKEERTKVNSEAKNTALDWLTNQDYNCNGIIKDYDKILNVKGADGIIYTVIVNSISGGKLYVRPINWLELDEDNTFLLTIDKGKVTKINSTEELLSRYAKTIMRIDNKQDIREEITTIAQITSHVATTQFVFFDIESKFDEIVKVYSTLENVENREIVFNADLNDDLDD